MKTRPDGIRPDAPASRMRWLAALTGIVLALTTVGFVAPAQAAVGPNVDVTLSFDDANADQMAAVNILNAAGVKGTFYIPSGFVGAAGWLTRDQLTSIAAGGHEIGGHSVNHPDLTTLPTAELTRQVCNDRATLSSWGFNVTSFAYPYAAVNAAAETAVANCGYNSARGLGDIQTPFGCAGCPFAETVPPADPYYVKAPDQVTSSWTLDNLKAAVTNAETTGGWLQLTFHHICATACDADGLSITPATLTSFVTWLAARSATNNTFVKTAAQVVGGAVKPVVGGPTPPPAGAGVNGVQNASLESTGSNGLPTCFQIGGFGTNTPVYTTVTPGHTGQIAKRLTVTNYVSGDSKLLMTMDLGACAPSVTAGHTYSLRAWYNSTASTQFNVQIRNAAGVWAYWTDSPLFAASANYTQAVWTTPAVPAGTTALAFGLNLLSNGQLVTDDYALYDTVGAPPATGGGTGGGTAPTVSRLAGADRFATAIQISKQFSPGVPRVYLANGWNFPDGLSSAAAAAHFSSPVLLTEQGSLPASVRAEIQRLNPGTIVVAGGPAAVSNAVVTQLQALGTTVRIGGTDRYDTSRLIAKNAFGTAATAYVASGNDYPDALAASPAATKFAGPVVLIPGKAASLDASSVNLLKSLGATSIKIAGGPVAVSTGVEATLKSAFGAGAVKRFAGSDRYGTAVAINKDAFSASGTAYLASGGGFADALAGGALAGVKAAPLYLTPQSCLLPSVNSEFTRLAAKQVVLFGGQVALSNSVQSLVQCR